ncbi:type III secretion system (T3SS) inner membrane Yop/YscD-like protein [Micromonospora sp. Llam0]|uniref:FHA domain-containing protein n=1 Tax=Micromonospora sp. Llam0 TaxID=2485143 RepID=UPI000F4966C6|nr:FHA domain-containing protein [Micromonospora sp. Llam0]ROO62224.1 type III secretion system (T3SS) inner membrane Yop/YscD-like protein [Micromonospora sp. Llam0]
MSEHQSLLPLLQVITGPTPGASYRLSPGNRVIGRDAGLDITIDDIKVSRCHAVIAAGGGRTVLTDQESTNGTWVNDLRIRQPTELRDGDRIRIGGVELRFYDPASALTDPVGTRIPRPATAALPGAPVRPTTGPGSPLHTVLGEPTQPMRPRRRPSTLLMAGLAGVFLVGWLTWMVVVLS